MHLLNIAFRFPICIGREADGVAQIAPFTPISLVGDMKALSSTE